MNDNKDNNCCYLLSAHCVPGTVQSNISWIASFSHYNSLVTLFPFTGEETGHRENKDLLRVPEPWTWNLNSSQVARAPVCPMP